MLTVLLIVAKIHHALFSDFFVFSFTVLPLLGTLGGKRRRREGGEGANLQKARRVQNKHIYFLFFFSPSTVKMNCVALGCSILEL